MRSYILTRIAGLIPTLMIISVIIFIVIQLPEGDIVSSMLDRLQAQGVDTSRNTSRTSGAIQPRQADGDSILYWAGNFLTGDMGYSYLFSRPVNELVWERLGYTLSITISALFFTWLVALPVGIYSALRQYTIGDYFMTTLALVGLATPPFLLALIFMHIGFEWFGISTGGPLLAGVRGRAVELCQVCRHARTHLAADDHRRRREERPSPCASSAPTSSTNSTSPMW